ncbi:MAG: FAD:protein FMN transferase [Candidatus Binatia bacterium]
MNRAALAALIAIGTLVARRLPAVSVTEIHYVMGTYFRVTAEDPDPARARAAMRACFVIAREVDRRFSRFDPSSELSEVNASAAGSGPLVVSEEMAALLRRALMLQARTDGAFDIGVGALTQLWRTSTGWPSRAAIDAARQSAGAGAFELIGTTLIRKPGVLLDVDGVAKGWAVDRCAERLRAAGVRQALVNLGESSLYAVGAAHDTPGWDVTVRGLDDVTVVGTMTLRDEAVSVSSVFGHSRRIGSGRVGHLVDPRSGQALRAPAIAVVVAPSATDAEAFSKALLVEPDTQGGDSRWANDPSVSTVLIAPDRIRQTGRAIFHPYKTPRPVGAAAEPLR